MICYTADVYAAYNNVKRKTECNSKINYTFYILHYVLKYQMNH